jgi:hypothetical protein
VPHIILPKFTILNLEFRMVLNFSKERYTYATITTDASKIWFVRYMNNQAFQKVWSTSQKEITYQPDRTEAVHM